MGGEFYYERPRERRRGRGLTLLLLDGAMGVLTLAAAVLLVLMYLTPYVPPQRSMLFSLIGLVAPAIYLGGTVTMLYWIIRWRWRYAVPLALLLAVGLFNLSLYYKIDMRRHYGEPVFDRSALKVLTYNVRMFYGDDGQDTTDSLAAFVRRLAPDIVCFQEFRDDSTTLRTVDSLLAGYARVHYAREHTYTALALYARPKILRSGALDCLSEGDNTRAVSMWADLRLEGGDTVRIFNNHLRSTHITAGDGDYLMQHRYLTDTAGDGKLRDIVRRVHRNSVQRAAQVDTIARAIAASPHAVIVCGDFNDTPLSYAYHRMAQGLDDAFRACGRGFSHTYRGFYNTFRIDFVLASEAFRTLGYEVPDVDYSDHRPVFVHFDYSTHNEL